MIEPVTKSSRVEIYHGNALEVLKQFDENSVDCVITSPPYYSKRDYCEEAYTIWGGDPNCNHEWEFVNPPPTKLGLDVFDDNLVSEDLHHSLRFEPKRCVKCGAYYTQLGLEPTPFEFVEHLAMIFSEVYRILKKDGNMFVVIDDTYSRSGSWSSGGGLKYKDNEWERTWVKNIRLKKPPSATFTAANRKSLCLVPEMLAIKLVYDLGFVLRSKIIWAKKVWLYNKNTTIGTAKPESVGDRLAHTYEFVYHFTKSPKHYSGLDNVRIPHKPQSVLRANRADYSENPYIHSNIKRGGKHERLHVKGANPGDVVQINLQFTKHKHYAPFAENLVKMLIELGCPEGGLVMDPFMGSGTTLVTALKMGRKAIGIEICRDYVNLAVERVKPYMVNDLSVWGVGDGEAEM